MQESFTQTNTRQKHKVCKSFSLALLSFSFLVHYLTCRHFGLLWQSVFQIFHLPYTSIIARKQVFIPGLHTRLLLYLNGAIWLVLNNRRWMKMMHIISWPRHLKNKYAFSLSLAIYWLDIKVWSNLEYNRAAGSLAFK